MYDVLAQTAWKMESLKAYGLFHIMYFLIGISICFFIAHKMRKIEIKKLNKILFGIGVFLFLIETYRQLFYTFYIGNGNYQYWTLPFQLCSIPIYLCLLIPFIKNEKIQKAFYTFLISYNFLGGFIAFLEPSGLINEYVTLTAQSFIWHMVIVLIGAIISRNQNIKFEKKDFKHAVYLFCILCLIAFAINLILWYPANKDINMFFIGPQVSPLAVFHDIATRFGWYINTPLYIFALTLGAYIFYHISTIKKN